MNRGMVAAEMSKSPAEYNEAISEFEQAVKLAPDWSAPYFNLGYIQKEAGDYQDALNNYRKYLVLVPDAPDAAQVQVEIDQIEYKLEKVSEAAKIRSWLEGEWIGDVLSCMTSSWPFCFIVNSDSVNVYTPITLSVINEKGGSTLFTEYETIVVKQEGKRIQFTVVLKNIIRERGIWGL